MKHKVGASGADRVKVGDFENILLVILFQTLAQNAPASSPP